MSETDRRLTASCVGLRATSKAREPAVAASAMLKLYHQRTPRVFRAWSTPLEAMTPKRASDCDELALGKSPTWPGATASPDVGVRHESPQPRDNAAGRPLASTQAVVSTST